MTSSLWIDVEDLFEYALANPRPSGIQRLAFEIYSALQMHRGSAGTVRFLRHAPASNSFRVVPWSEVATLFAGLTEGKLPNAPVREAIRRHGPLRRLIRRLVHRLPTSLRLVMIDVMLTNIAAAHAWSRLLFTLARAALEAPLRVARRHHAADRTDHRSLSDKSFNSIDFAVAAAPGDVVLVLGSPWFHPDYPGLIRNLQKKHGLQFGMLVYDLIPLLRPEWCDRGLVRLFREWFVSMLPLCDHVFAISKATAADVEAFAAGCGVTLPYKVVSIPVGTGWTGTPVASGSAGRAASSSFPASKRDLPVAGSYALVVSTIEARKNHLLLFRVWRRLLEDMPPECVPTLVFAGRIGWLVEDLMHQISNTANLGGKLVIVENPSDTELTALYRGCLFTMFPSFYEGWGLPVTESLAFGKPCLISNRTSLPEAGGLLARSFDPDNLNDAYAAIRNVIEDRPDLERWEEQIRREFRPVLWSTTAEAILAELAKRNGSASPTSAEPVLSKLASSNDRMP